MLLSRDIDQGSDLSGSSPLPLMDMQRAYYIGKDAENGGEAFLYFEIDFEEFDPARFESAWKTLYERHDALRITLFADGSQTIRHDTLPQIEIADLRELTRSARDRELAGTRHEITTERAKDDGLLRLKISLLDENAARVHFRISLLVVDGLGLAVLLSELSELYDTPTAELGAPPSYANAVSKLSTPPPRRDEALAWWNDRLVELPGPPELPVACTPGNAPLQRRRFELEPALWHGFHSAAVLHGLTPSMALCAALTEVIGAFSSTRDFLMALMLSARPHNDRFDRVVGNFSTLALLPVFPQADTSFVARALALQERFFGSMEYSAVSGLEVLSMLNQRNNMMLNAAAPVVFSSNLHLPLTTPGGKSYGPFSIYGEEWAYSALQTPQVLIDVSVSISRSGSLVIHWDSRETLFPTGFIDTITEVFIALLNELSASPQAWEIPFLPLPDNQKQVRDNANATRIAPPGKRLHEPFFDGLSQHHEQIAVVDEHRSVSYGQLAETARTIAAQINHRRIKPNTLVAIVMDKGWEQIAAVLGVLLSGAAYVPIDPSLPKDRRFYLIESSEVTLALTTPTLNHELAWPDKLERYALSDKAAQMKPGDIARPGEHDLAYIIFTSGSTGTPKGVMIEHEGAANTVADINRRFRINEHDRAFGISALNFDLSVWDIFGILGAGGTLVLPNADRVSDPAHWYDLIHSNRITVWNSAPPVMQLLVEYIESTGGKLPPSLRLVMLSGDWIPTTLPERIRSLATQEIEVVSLGGATEASIWSVYYNIGKVDPQWVSIPYGKPLSNQTLHVLDAQLHPKPDWVAGEIYIGGMGLARGYWKDGDKTNDSFIAGAGGGQRLYKTGDLGRYLPDGNIEFLGRRDNQIKLRGYRIELGEIESFLIRDPDVIAAAAGVREQGAEKILAAYCVVKDATDKDKLPGRLLESLANALPGYMVPQTLFLLPSLPLNINGKIDRKGLSQLELKTHSGDLDTGTGEVEKKLSRLMAQILGHERVGIEENFFQIGGHSFAAVRLMATIRQEFHVELPISALLVNPTVRRLAQMITNAEAGNKRLVRLRKGLDGTPVFFIHAAGGNILAYQHLSEALPESIPFYALEAKGLAEGEEPSSAIEQMAEEYVELVKETMADTGPIILGGWSSGGVVAFEMAHRLSAAGIDVKHLLMVDTPAPLERDSVSERLAIEWFITDLFGGEANAIDRETVSEPTLRLASAIEARLADNGTDPTNTESRARLNRTYHVFRSTLDALRTYEPRPLSIPTTLFKAQGPAIQEFLSHPALHKDDWGWSPWLTTVSKQSLEGNHYQILTGTAIHVIAESIAEISLRHKK